MSPKQPPVLSPVDYDAWSRGYMPPSEHVLIDALAHRGAKVKTSVSMGNVSWWLVVQGEPNRKALKAIQRALLECDLEEPNEPPPSSQTEAAQLVHDAQQKDPPPTPDRGEG